jgi:hypothetical protein
VEMNINNYLKVFKDILNDEKSRRIILGVTALCVINVLIR